ncbi:MAG: hypothetical protein AB2704_18445, partial [Candidatus Thiodiazotropha taylori]
GVMPTRYSWFLISLGTPTSISLSSSIVGLMMETVVKKRLNWIAKSPVKAFNIHIDHHNLSIY